MDHFSHHEHVLDRATLTYNRRSGQVDLSIGPDNKESVNEDLIVYKNLHFEHSDTCPSRRNREKAEEEGGEPKISKKTLKMAACAYVMDKDDNILLTRRPSSLRIFPQAWVLPGGIVDPGERFEDACLREVHEEIGLKAIK